MVFEIVTMVSFRNLNPFCINRLYAPDYRAASPAGYEQLHLPETRP
jgi:hypothetical protein